MFAFQNLSIIFPLSFSHSFPPSLQTNTHTIHFPFISIECNQKLAFLSIQFAQQSTVIGTAIFKKFLGVNPRKNKVKSFVLVVAVVMLPLGWRSLGLCGLSYRMIPKSQWNC